ncbi:hypothetical protein ACFWOT_26260 [Streptomyces sp. NPDC058440]
MPEITYIRGDATKPSAEGGCGLADGIWERVGPLIEERLVRRGSW